jgi:hypothetical protein
MNRLMITMLFCAISVILPSCAMKQTPLEYTGSKEVVLRADMGYLYIQENSKNTCGFFHNTSLVLLKSQLTTQNSLPRFEKSFKIISITKLKDDSLGLYGQLTDTQEFCRPIYLRVCFKEPKMIEGFIEAVEKTVNNHQDGDAVYFKLEGKKDQGASYTLGCSLEKTKLIEGLNLSRKNNSIPALRLPGSSLAIIFSSFIGGCIFTLIAMKVYSQYIG